MDWIQETQNDTNDGAPIYYKNIIKITLRSNWAMPGGCEREASSAALSSRSIALV